MSIRQNILKTFYPLLMKMNGTSDKNSKVLLNNNIILPAFSFYYLTASDNKGNKINFDRFAGKKILIVNTASDCGFTPQYNDLQNLYNKYNGKFNLLGFPSNDFGKQEKGTDEEIAEFCRTNYKITFPLMKKSVVLKKSGQNDVFKWLTDPRKNGWNSQQPDWNFSKYIVNEKGVLTHYFGPAVSPLSKEVELVLE
jgi:glutathione peroxidase